MKRFIEGEDRSQCVLLPPSLDDYVAEDNRRFPVASEERAATRRRSSSCWISVGSSSNRITSVQTI